LGLGNEPLAAKRTVKRANWRRIDVVTSALFVNVGKLALTGTVGPQTRIPQKKGKNNR
jgi:hypothetical protein